MYIPHPAKLKIHYLRVEGDCHRLKQSLILNDIEASTLNIAIRPTMALVDIPAFTSEILDMSCFLSTEMSLTRLQLQFSSDSPQVVSRVFFQSFTSCSLTEFVVIRENSDGVWLVSCMETLPRLRELVMLFPSSSDVARLLRKSSLESLSIIYGRLTAADLFAMAKELPTSRVSTLVLMNRSFDSRFESWLAGGLEHNFSMTCLVLLTSKYCHDWFESSSYVKRNVFLANQVPELLMGDEREILALWPQILSKLLANGWTGVSYQLLRNRMDLFCACR